MQKTRVYANTNIHIQLKRGKTSDMPNVKFRYRFEVFDKQLHHSKGTKKVPRCGIFCYIYSSLVVDYIQKKTNIPNLLC